MAERVERLDRLASVLDRAHEVHAVVTERAGGVDPEWALFYAWWLINWSDLPEILGRTPALGELTAFLVAVDVRYRAAAPHEPWQAFYARELLAQPA
jgi:hypothetical protein